MDSWGSQDILAGFEPADPRSNRGESVDFYRKKKKISRYLTGIMVLSKEIPDQDQYY